MLFHLADPRRATPVALSFNTRKSIDQSQAGVVFDHRFGGGNEAQLTAYYGERSTQQFQAIPVATQQPATHPGGLIDLARRFGGLDARWIHKDRLLEQPFTLTAGLSADRLSHQQILILHP